MSEREAAAAAHAAYRQARHFGSLDGLRFLCIVAVMWHHSPAHGSLETPLRLIHRGFLGVDFFFVLSGFLITTLLLRERARTGRISLSGFYWRRILRIVPVYFLVVSAVSAYYVLVKGETQYTDLVPYYYLFLSNFLKGDIPLLSITWSLSVEEQYYLIWPVLLVLLSRWRGAVAPALVALIAINVAASAGLLAPLGFRTIETETMSLGLPASNYAAILIGSLAAVILHDASGFGAAWRILGHRLAPAAAFAALIAAVALAPGRLDGWPNLAIHALMAAALATVVVREDNLLRPLLAWRPVARIGEISYGIYLYHLIAMHVAGLAFAAAGLGRYDAPWALTLAFMALSVAMAEVSFRTFEKAFRDLKDRGVARPAMATATAGIPAWRRVGRIPGLGARRQQAAAPTRHMAGGR